jgi:hypothetical protein
MVAPKGCHANRQRKPGLDSRIHRAGIGEIVQLLVRPLLASWIRDKMDGPRVARLPRVVAIEVGQASLQSCRRLQRFRSPSPSSFRAERLGDDGSFRCKPLARPPVS